MKSFPYWNLSMLNQAWPWTQRRNYESQTQTNHQRHVASQAIRGLLTDIAVIRSSRQVPLSPSAQHFTCCFHTSLTFWLILLGSFHVITKSKPFCLLKHNKTPVWKVKKANASFANVFRTHLQKIRTNQTARGWRGWRTWSIVAKLSWK